MSKTVICRFFILMTSVAFAVFVAHTVYTKTAIFADSRFYYAITRSIVKDFDIKFANEYTSLGVGIEYTNNNYVWNQYPPGVALFWIPLFTVTDALVTILNALPFTDMSTSGFGFIYEMGVAATNILLGIAGLYLVLITLDKYFNKTSALLTILTLFSTTNLLFYIAVEPINSHAVSFFVAALFVHYFLRYDKDRYYWLVVGLIAGVAGLVRTQDATILILPLIKNLKANAKVLKKLTSNFILITAGFLLAFSPQIYFWKKIFNTYWYSPYAAVGFDFLNPQIIHVLLNRQNGLIYLTPVIGISFIGLVLILKKNQAVFGYAVIYFLLQLYLISSWGSYYQGGSYSIRMMITVYPLVAFGTAALFTRLLKALNFNIALSVIFILGFINTINIIKYLLAF